MGVKIVRASIVFVLLFFALLGEGLEEENEIEELLSCRRVNSASEERVGNSAVSLWTKCKFGLIKSREADLRRYLTSELLQITTEAPSPAPSPNSDIQGAGSSNSGPKKSSKSKHVIVAIVITAVAVFFISAILFLFCCKAFRKGSGYEHKDDRPLLGLSLSDSAGSFSKSFAVDNSYKKTGNHSYHPELSDKKRNGSLDSKLSVTSYTIDASVTGAAKFSEESTSISGNINAPTPPLKLPPGMIPLKPPPGRAKPLAPEPPASFRRPPNRAGRPPATLAPSPLKADSSGVASQPPGPPPPPPLKTSSGVASQPPAPPPPPPLKTSSGVASQPPAPPPPPPVPPASKPGPHPPPPPVPPASKPGPHPPPPPAPSASKPGPHPPPPPAPASKHGPQPPPPPKIGVVPPRPPPGAIGKGSGNTSGGASKGEDDDAAPKTKLKPFFWDKVPANPDHSMVWHQIKSGSFQFDEETIEMLFGYNPQKNKTEQAKESSSHDPPPQFIQIIDSKKAQNLSILLRAMNVTREEVLDALMEGNELPSELLETLLKMAPTPEEELKLRLFSGKPSQLGPAERFLKGLVEIPFAFERLEALFFMSTLQEEVAALKESFTTLEVACKELRSSRLFLKLLEAVLKTGNRMNDGTFRGGAQAFKLDTLLKLSDVRGTDGKTTLLHFVVQEIIRSEGIRAARALGESHSLSSIKSDDLPEDTAIDTDEEHYRSLGLQVVSGLGSQLENVKAAACLDTDILTGTVAKLENALMKTRNFLNSEMQNVEGENGFRKALEIFVQHAESDIMSLLEEEKKIMGLVKSTAEYFHGDSGKEEGLRLFVVVRDFLLMVDKACREVREKPRKPTRKQKRDPPSHETSAETTPSQPPGFPRRLFPAIAERRADDYSSDDD
ncbi:hypothetical protein Nepgr_007537 [Nepenthes gracilis]|uniref:Formin-like protein n=1 Tax=Nepenthes gracilis TaxID=150966 RepID=A0AAD3XIC4_NEPGR|nr:hypothetical protein Nepgr_007537 [Nepenthes gracilis]